MEWPYIREESIYKDFLLSRFKMYYEFKKAILDWFEEIEKSLKKFEGQEAEAHLEISIDEDRFVELYVTVIRPMSEEERKQKDEYIKSKDLETFNKLKEKYGW